MFSKINLPDIPFCTYFSVVNFSFDFVDNLWITFSREKVSRGFTMFHGVSTSPLVNQLKERCFNKFNFKHLATFQLCSQIVDNFHY
ncbi:MAG: hypothetical protein B6D45_02280 [Ignavibacteriales bacterium UTCHB3]|nr:MAG: hypothetical protein B6D45_02280 [Ignavibacteriales bacterium UTCHB3]